MLLSQVAGIWCDAELRRIRHEVSGIVLVVRLLVRI